MRALFNQLFDYNFYCNKKLIEQCMTMEKVPQQVQQIFSHILNTHHVWNKRLLGQEKEYDLWQLQSLVDWEEMHYDNQRLSFGIITNAQDFTKRIEYKTTAGRVFTNELKDVLFHIINHTTHHRGQLMVLLKPNDSTVEGLDYINYKR